MPLTYILNNAWQWLVDTGINLGLLVVLALLVPRFGRLAMRLVEHKVAEERADESKSHLAFAGVAIYIAQLIAYFVIFVFMLQQLGFSLAGAAIPATAASAAIGLGAQSIIADFLAGFFVLSEKQYGVGDWVRFEGGATTVEGTVIQITMRATHIRTLAEETVIIPNSKAGVSINNSNYWSSAVVVMPIPLLASGSIDEAIQRSTNAARRALRSDQVAAEILGELSVHESVGINPPATVGSPWTMNMRFVVQVNPGTQWRVERCIRTEVIKEFWQEYGSAPTLDGRVATTLRDTQSAPPLGHTDGVPTSPRGVDPTPTLQWAPVPPPIRDFDQPFVDPAATDKGQRLLSEEDSVRPQDVSDDARFPAASHVDPSNRNYRELVESTEGLTNQGEDSDSTNESGVRRWITVGGRTRTSTALLLLCFLMLLLLRGLTLQTGDGYRDGWLAPSVKVTSVAPPPSATPPSAAPESTSTEPLQQGYEPIESPAVDTPTTFPEDPVQETVVMPSSSDTVSPPPQTTVRTSTTPIPEADPSPRSTP